MPIANRCIEPVEVSRVKVPDSVENEFEYVVNATLTNFIKQLACLSVKANEIFGELIDNVTEITIRSKNLENKVNHLSKRISLCDEKNTTPNFVPPKVEVFRTSKIDDELNDHTKTPDCIMEIFSEAEPPPNLKSFDVFRKEGEESLKFYTDPQFFLGEWLKSTNVNKVKKRKKRKSKDNLLYDPNNNQSVRLKPPPPPPNINKDENFETEMGLEPPTPENSFGDGIFDMSYKSISYFADSDLVPQQKLVSNIPLPPPPAPPGPPPPADGYSVIPTNLVPPPSSVPMLFSPHPEVYPEVYPDAGNVVPVSTGAPTHSAGINDLLSQIREGKILRPVSQKQENKKEDEGWRGVIDKIRVAWDQTSESSSTSSFD